MSGRKKFVLAHGGLHDRLHVQGGQDGLPELLVREHAHLVVENANDVLPVPDDDRFQPRILFEPSVGIGHDPVGEIIVAALHARDSRCHFGDGVENEIVGVSDLLPAEPRLGFAARRIFVEAGELDVPVRYSFDELKGSGSDKLLHLAIPCLLDDLFRIDARELIDIGEGRQDDRRGAFHLQLNGIFVNGSERIHLGKEPFPHRGNLPPAADGCHHVGRCHLLAVMERNALPQLDRVELSIFADLVGIGQHGDDGILVVKGEKGFKIMVSYDGNDGGRGPVGIHGWRLSHVGDP